MRMPENQGAAESSCRDVVMIGVKPENESKELLTWVLVKVAKPGDTVIALHVIGKKEIRSHGGASSFFSLVTAFDSVLSVYEGFCNLKQVDLKLKICRGSSVMEALVREAKSNAVTKLVVGAVNQTLSDKLSTVVAKHCSKKLSKLCSVVAVHNGKVVFQTDKSQDPQENRPNRLLNVLLRSATAKRNEKKHPKEDCSISSKNASPRCSLNRSCGDLVSAQKETPFSTSNLRQLKEIQDMKPGWPLLRSNVLSESSRIPSRKISVVQWAMKLPSRQLPNIKPSNSVQTVEIEVPEYFRDKHSATCKLFSYEELITATSDFAKDNLIGQGGSSQVYRGCLTDGSKIAVKVMKRSDESLKEFALEIEIITCLCHDNIVSLKGFGFEAKNLFFIYDLLSRGSLEENLYGKKSSSFGWDQRYRVALGVAEALTYLHAVCSQSVIHRDVKSSNILLSEDFKPQLADFGLATWAPTSASHITCMDVSGTFGYLAPEYFMYGKVNYKTDVYAFGVVLLELLSGRKPISNELPKGQESLVMWANPLLKSGNFTQFLDPNLDSSYDSDRTESLILAAILCTRRSPRARPQMNLIVRLLKGDDEATEWAKAQVSGEESDSSEDEACPAANLQSHLNLALLDVEDDSLSASSVEQSVSLEDYLKGRWSRSSSFE